MHDNTSPDDGEWFNSPVMVVGITPVLALPKKTIAFHCPLLHHQQNPLVTNMTRLTAMSDLKRR